MTKKDSFCILFAGVAGSSKTPVAYYLSWNLNLPIFNNDTIRVEVKEDSVMPDQKDSYQDRRRRRLSKLISSRKDFIYDASVDRRWPELRKSLKKRQYRSFIISYNLSREFIVQLYEAKNYTAEHLDRWLEDHNNFLEKYRDEVNLQISDKQFANRLDLSLNAVENWLN